jgi:hypothetical protein
MIDSYCSSVKFEKRFFSIRFCVSDIKFEIVFNQFEMMIKSTDLFILAKLKSHFAGTNHNLQLHNNQMSMTTVGKNVLTASHTKYCVTGDFSPCVPFP